MLHCKGPQPPAYDPVSGRSPFRIGLQKFFVKRMHICKSSTLAKPSPLILPTAATSAGPPSQKDW